MIVVACHVVQEEPRPEHTVTASELRTSDRSLEDGELLPKGPVLSGQLGPAGKQQAE